MNRTGDDPEQVSLLNRTDEESQRMYKLVGNKRMLGTGYSRKGGPETPRQESDDPAVKFLNKVRITPGEGKGELAPGRAAVTKGTPRVNINALNRNSQHH